MSASAHDFPKFVKVGAEVEHELRKVGTGMSTSMKKMYFALLASACWLGFGFPQAAANEAEFVTDPVALHPDQSEKPPAPAPVRLASADRPSMGGGFIEFLFGDRQGQDQVYRQQPAYQQQPSYQQQPMVYQAPMMAPQAMGLPLMSEPARPAFDP